MTLSDHHVSPGFSGVVPLLGHPLPCLTHNPQRATPFPILSYHSITAFPAFVPLGSFPPCRSRPFSSLSLSHPLPNDYLGEGVLDCHHIFYPRTDTFSTVLRSGLFLSFRGISSAGIYGLRK